MGERFAGRVAIVTGGVSGIGAGIAARLAADGARVSVWDHDAAALAKAAAAHTVSVDVADAEAVQRAAEDTAAALGKIDILIACAGITGPVAPVWEYQVAAWDSVINVNLNGVFYCNRAVVPHMLRNGYGRIVNIASIAGKEGNPNAAAYFRIEGRRHRADQVARQGTGEHQRAGQLRHAGRGAHTAVRTDDAGTHRLHAVEDPARPFRRDR